MIVTALLLIACFAQRGRVQLPVGHPPVTGNFPQNHPPIVADLNAAGVRIPSNHPNIDTAIARGIPLPGGHPSMVLYVTFPNAAPLPGTTLPPATTPPPATLPPAQPRTPVSSPPVNRVPSSVPQTTVPQRAPVVPASNPRPTARTTIPADDNGVISSSGLVGPTSILVLSMVLLSL